MASQAVLPAATLTFRSHVHVPPVLPQTDRRLSAHALDNRNTSRVKRMEVKTQVSKAAELEELRRELLRRIVENEARRRAPRGAAGKKPRFVPA